MEIEKNIINALLYNDDSDFNIPEDMYRTQYYKDSEQKLEEYRDAFSDVLPEILKKAYTHVCNIEDYAQVDNFSMGKVAGFAIALSLMKGLENLLDTHKLITESFTPVSEAYKIDDELIMKAINEYKERTCKTNAACN